MGKAKRRIAAVATVAALGGLGGIALESNPGHQTAGSAALASGSGRPIVTSSSGSTSSLAAVRSAGAPSSSTHRPVVTRTSGGGRPGEFEDD